MSAFFPELLYFHELDATMFVWMLNTY